MLFCYLLLFESNTFLIVLFLKISTNLQNIQQLLCDLGVGIRENK